MAAFRTFTSALRCLRTGGVSQQLSPSSPYLFATTRTTLQVNRQPFSTASAEDEESILPKIVFLGPPGVGKGTYAKRIAKWLKVPHIAVGDLLREQMKLQTELGKEAQGYVDKGALVPDETVLKVLRHVLDGLNETGGGDSSSSADDKQELYGRSIKSTGGYVLDGFPRSLAQAQELDTFQGINLVLNLFLREDVLIEKCLGRRICTKCNGNYNVADIYRAADPEKDKPEIVMPPLDVPEACKDTIVRRKDDTEEIILKRLGIYNAEAKPLEDFYRSKSLLLDYEISGGIDHTLPTLSPAVINGLKKT
jgi:adenylate kinase